MLARIGSSRLNAAALASLAAALTLGVCPGQIFPSSPDAAAKVISLTGQVSVLKGSDPWALNVGDSIQVQQVVVTGPDGFARFQVSDGSTFEVYPNSNVVFRKNPGNWRDLIDVLVGRVKIHIQKWGGQPNPNKIYTPTAVISVRGTTFDVSVDPESQTTLVTVEEGQVDVRHATKGGSSKLVNAGESLEIFRDSPLSRNGIDRGSVAQRVLRSLNDAVNVAMTHTRPGATGGTTGGVSGQTGGPPPPIGPPPPPAPPPPPPPPH